METREKIFLLDAFALIYRSYYAFINNPRQTSAGVNTSAAFGFCNFLLELLERERPTRVAVVFDPPGGTFRHAMFPAYKAQRPPMPEDLRRSIPVIKEIIDGMGIKQLHVEGYEADDVIGTLATRAEAEGFDVFMITPDKDYAQLVSDHVFMYKPGRGGNDREVWGVPQVTEHFGIERAEQVVDLLGLTGDVSDNVPGCPGIGPKGAAVLLGRFGSIDGVYQHVEELKGKQRENLLAARETVMLSRELVTICRDAPVNVAPGELTRSAVDVPTLERIFRELEFFTMSRRVPGMVREEVKAKVKEEVRAIVCREIGTREGWASLVESLKGAPVYAMHARFDRGSVHDALPETLAFAVTPDEASVARLPSDGEEARRWVESLRPVFEDEGKLLVSFDAKDDVIWTRRAGIDPRNGIFDAKIAHYVLQPDASHDLERVALEVLDYHLEGAFEVSPQLSLMFEEERDDRVQEMAERAGVIFRLRERLQEKLERVGARPLFEEVEMPLVSVLADMEYEGVSIDTRALEETAVELREKVAALEGRIFEMAGRTFNINSPKQLGEVLFDEMNVDAGNRKTKTGQSSTSEQVLVKLAGEHPIVSLILDYRGLKKLLSTYAEALPAYVNPATGKIHTHFNQAEAATGRLSSLNPNLQNIPVRTEEGRGIRKAFVTGDAEFCFFSADYSQVELRLMAHLSGARELIDAFLNGEDVHAATAAKIYRVPPGEVTPEMRRRAKTANFGIIYGISAWGLAERLQISRKEGKELIDGYFQLYPGVKEYMEKAVEGARAKGYVETIMGRRRYLTDINSSNSVVRGVAERNAVNAPIQGSAADIIKVAMIRVHREMKARRMKSRMILQVHDELDFTCHRSELDELRQLVTRCMEEVVPLAVPLSVSTGSGENWYEAH
ncbi:MAG: DNA polymerase I [Odoribacteraceae bacterium]|jgi:DNA polymerase-1|nr:DNA polymerase I [Odoribacteraceae bacterium]